MNTNWTYKDWMELYEERAAIMEYDGGLPRAEAEIQAGLEIDNLRRKHLKPAGD